jgi:hypothetical protein
MEQRARLDRLKVNVPFHLHSLDSWTDNTTTEALQAARSPEFAYGNEPTQEIKAKSWGSRQ